MLYHLAHNVTAWPKGMLMWLCLVGRMGGGVGDFDMP